MDSNHPIPSSSSPTPSGDDNPHPDSVNQSKAADDDNVTFRFNHLQIDSNDSNPQNLIPESSKTETDHSVNQPLAADDDVTFGFNHLQIDTNNDANPIQESSKADSESEDDEEDDGDFTFACVVDNDDENDDGDSSSYDVMEDGQIRKVFPLFDQSLLLSGESDDGKRRLPMNVPVDKVFIESPHRSPLSNGETDGTVHALPKESDPNMKSNSTGFSKLWRFRNNEMNRSHSDGRDAFVFLESSDASSTSDGKHNVVKVNVGKGKGKGVEKGLKEEKRKKLTASAHEVYLKQKGQTEDERRRSYLPYRPGLMGFFTNVNGGLSKNVHPF